ncbi:uncharacterized protein LOC106644374 [Copidosoma floridanum]|uniref:uncharacterized protein LOC106644374 n=1 Tax=Copidosoma floridanum TaxID=29053 RepID=UPI000C6FBF03|nr:uncharacterized protein LOC106644374 [Copidosoma floridanum]
MISVRECVAIATCGTTTRLLLLLASAALLVSTGSCQNAEPNRRPNNFRNSHVAMDYNGRNDETWQRRLEGSTSPESSSEDELVPSREEVARPSLSHAGGTGNEDGPLLLLPSSHGKFQPELYSKNSRQAQKDRRRKKRRRGKQPWSGETDEPESENLVNVGGRFRGKKKQSGEDAPSLTSSSSTNGMRKPGSSRAGKYREERRRRRRNRKRTRSRVRLENRREERKWRDNPIVRLIKILNEQKIDEARMLSENPLNLSSTARLAGTAAPARVPDVLNATSSSSLFSQLTTEPRVPVLPEPTIRYHNQPSDVEREFSRQVEREYTRAQLTEKSLSEEGDEEEDGEEIGESPRFDEQYAQVAKQPSAPFDPERMLGYSRTDEDLPILDMENEVLQRTIKDYNAYMQSSSLARNKEQVQSPDRGQFIPEPSPSSSLRSMEPMAPPESEDELRGDLSCINGTFMPAPLVQHAVIKYVKSSSPSPEYLEADYECEHGYDMLGNGSNRLLCRDRRWIGKLPVCKYRVDDEGSCAELGCDQLCRIVAGRAECLCREGYRLEDRKCIDIDECLANEGRGPCEDTCRNVAGGYFCSCEGLPMATLAPDNHMCQEPPATTARDTGDGVDGSLCNYDNAGCSHTCLASMGRVFCLCPYGFMLEDDWKTCQDVDECAVPDLQTEVCRWGCINTPGSYRCTQPPLHVTAQDLVWATVAKNKGDCRFGFEPSDNKSCIDVDECSIENGGCSEVCENTEGSYFCACEGDERVLAPDRRSCVGEDSGVTCSLLNPAGRGQLICSDTGYEYPWRRRRRSKNKPGTKCHLKCPRGYELHGEFELTCLADGTWDGPKHGECLRYSKPRLDCPKDVIAELPPGRDEAFVTYDQPSTDLDWFRYVRSKPSWGTRLEANLKRGTHEITFLARHPVSKKQATCTLKINVQEGQAPKVQGCPGDIEITGKNGSAITWIEPVFTDNVKVTRVTSNESPGRTFSIGGHKIEYEAADDAGWTTKCIFTVVLRPVSG